MTTLVLSKKQQRQALSAKKGPVKGLRNVLAQPQQLYWPVLKPDQCGELEQIFRKSTTSMKRQIEQMPWSQLKRLSKEERSEIRKKEREKKKNTPNKQIIEAAVTGTNAVTRALEKNRICSVLLDAHIDPPLLVKHIVMMAQNKKIPVLLVPFLRSASSESIGFTCIAFALKEEVCKSSDHHFYPLYNKIREHSSNLLPPSNSTQLLEEDESKEEAKSYISLSNNDTSTNREEKEDKPKDTKEFVLSTNVYKYRSSVQERVFVPSNTKSNNDDKAGPNDFIGLGDSDSEIEAHFKVMKGHKRYIDVHDTTDKESDEATNMDNSEQINFISIKDSSANDEVKEIKLTTSDNETETETSISKSNEKKRKISNVTYMPLKIKRVQGNNNRLKATKTSKKKKAG